MSGGKLVAIFSGLQEFFGHAARIETHFAVHKLKIQIPCQCSWNFQRCNLLTKIPPFVDTQFWCTEDPKTLGLALHVE